MEKINFSKKGIQIVLQPRNIHGFDLLADNLYEYEGGEKVEKAPCTYENGRIRFLFGDFCIKAFGKFYNGITIDDKNIEKQILAVLEKQEEKKRQDQIKLEKNKKDRELHRQSPVVDEEKFVVYNVGCDTGLIHPEAKRKVVELAIKKGAQVTPVLRGERDGTNKYPGHMDSRIDSSYAKKIDGHWVADGYSYVYVDLYCISIEDFEAAKKIIEEQENTAKKEKEELLQSAFAEAKKTGKPVLLSKYVVHEQDSPLASDGENDMVDICTYAMPDGTISEKYFHNY